MKTKLTNMMKSTKQKIGIGAACCLMIFSGTILSSSVFARNGGVNNTAQTSNAKTASITTDEANAIALKRTNGGEIRASKLDRDDRVLKYEITIVNGDTKYEVDIDANTGEILKYESEKMKTNTQTQNTQNVTATITAEEANAIALKKTNGGEVRSSKLDRDDRVLQYEITIINGGTKHEVDVDAYTGEILKYESEKIATQQTPKPQPAPQPDRKSVV